MPCGILLFGGIVRGQNLIFLLFVEQPTSIARLSLHHLLIIHLVKVLQRLLVDSNIHAHVRLDGGPLLFGGQHWDLVIVKVYILA